MLLLLTCTISFAAAPKPALPDASPDIEKLAQPEDYSDLVACRMGAERARLPCENSAVNRPIHDAIENFDDVEGSTIRPAFAATSRAAVALPLPAGTRTVEGKFGKALAFFEEPR